MSNLKGNHRVPAFRIITVSNEVYIYFLRRKIVISNSVYLENTPNLTIIDCPKDWVIRIILFEQFDQTQIQPISNQILDSTKPFFHDIVDLLFYVHGKHLRSCRDGQLT